MTLWHLAWMHVTAWLIIIGAIAVPFVATYALDYSDAERFKRKRLLWMAWRKHHEHDGLPCILDHWAHGPLELTAYGRFCRRCGWKEPEAH